MPQASLVCCPLPATVGEVWMVGYLLIKGMPGRPRVPGQRDSEGAVP
jgi:hypothetical protein